MLWPRHQWTQVSTVLSGKYLNIQMIGRFVEEYDMRRLQCKLGEDNASFETIAQDTNLGRLMRPTNAETTQLLSPEGHFLAGVLVLVLVHKVLKRGFVIGKLVC